MQEWCLPTAPGCQLEVAETSVHRRFLGSSRIGSCLNRALTYLAPGLSARARMAPEERPLRGAADIAIPGIAIDHYLQFRFRGCGSASVSRSFSSDASFLNDLRPFFDIFLHELFQFVGRAGYDFGTLPCQ